MSEIKNAISIHEIIAVTGFPGTGKSSFSQLLAHALGGTPLSFGDDIFRPAKARNPKIGLSISEQIKLGRPGIAAKTLPLIRDAFNGLEITCRPGPLVFDFHPPTEDVLITLGHRPAHTFYLVASARTRFERYESRNRHGDDTERLHEVFARRNRLYQDYVRMHESCETLESSGPYHVINAENPLDVIVPQAIQLFQEAREERLEATPA